VNNITGLFALYVTTQVHSSGATIAMTAIQVALGSTIAKISDHRYDRSIAFHRLWFEMAQTYSEIPPDQIFDDIYNNGWSAAVVDTRYGKLIHPTVHLILRFASDAESDPILGPHSVGLQVHLCTRILRGFFENHVSNARSDEQGIWGAYFSCRCKFHRTFGQGLAKCISEYFDHFQSVESDRKWREVHRSALPEAKSSLHRSERPLSAPIWRGKPSTSNWRPEVIVTFADEPGIRRGNCDS